MTGFRRVLSDLYIARGSWNCNNNNNNNNNNNTITITIITVLLLLIHIPPSLVVNGAGAVDGPVPASVTPATVYS